jgi:hypothetical protein
MQTPRLFIIALLFSAFVADAVNVDILLRADVPSKAGVQCVTSPSALWMGPADNEDNPIAIEPEARYFPFSVSLMTLWGQSALFFGTSIALHLLHHVLLI